MNKLKLIQILKQLLILYKNNELSVKTYQNVLANIPLQEISDNLVSYHETDFLCCLFQEVPYYQVFTFLNNFCIELNRIEQETKNKDCVISLLQAYLSDLINSIVARVSTEVSAHIYELAMIFYQSNHLDPEKIIPKLLKNRCNPSFLTSVETAQSINYEQEILPGFSSKKEDLRESISRSNYRKRNSIENNTQKMITRYFDETTFEKFLVEVKNCIQIYQQQNLRDGEILSEEILMRLKLIYQKSLKTWQEPKVQEEGIQYKIQFSNN